jgi:hypothetical protein
VLRKIFGPKREKVTGEWRELRSGGLSALRYSKKKIHLIK